MKAAGKIVRFGGPKKDNRDPSSLSSASSAAGPPSSSSTSLSSSASAHAGTPAPSHLARGGVSFNSSPDLGVPVKAGPQSGASGVKFSGSTIGGPTSPRAAAAPAMPSRLTKTVGGGETENETGAGAGLAEQMKLSTGYLNKLSAGDTGTRHPRWKRRWFAFDSNLKMVYWHSEEEAKANPRKPTGEVDLSLCSTKDEKVHDKRFVFCIVTARYNIYLEAASHEEMLGWMCSIDEVKMKMVERGDFAKKPRVSSMIRKEKRRGELMMLVEAKNEDEEDRWEKLYFILKQNNFLCCYTNKDESTMAGPPIDLLICTIQEVPGESWCFEIMEGRRVYWLMAQSELEMCSWISSLRNAITSAQAGVFHERLSLKPQFQADHVAKSGWLKKLKIKWGWNRRWFVLQGEYLVYYRSPQHAQPAPSEQKVQRDAISTLFTKARQLTGAKSNCFELLTALRSFRFEADSEADAQAWVQAIENLNQTLIKTQLRDPLEGRRTMQLKLMDVQKALA